MNTPIMQLTDIEKHFCSIKALSNVSIKIIQGWCYCLFGEKGAGKSTFIKIMSCVHQPTSGHIYFSG